MAIYFKSIQDDKMNSEYFMKARIVFVIQNCVKCSIWKSFIEKYNSKIPIEKRIQVIDVTKYHDFGIIENPLIRIFHKFLFKDKGYADYPIMFFEGERIEGASTRLEMEAWLKTKLFNDFIINEHSEKYMLNEECQYVDTFLGRKVICS